MNIGIIGGGAIAQFLLEEINLHKQKGLQITSVYIRDEKKYEHLRKQYHVNLFSDINEFLQSNIDIIVEAANVQAVHQLLPTILKQKDVIIVSMGAFAKEIFSQEIYAVAEASKQKVYLPSGAIGGLDLLQNAHSLDEVSRVSLTTRKPANSLTNEQLGEEKVVFSGSAANAIEKFPKNINVSIILSLAGIGTEDTKVTIIADPSATKNEHTIQIAGKFGTASLAVTNNPMQDNPNTSYLAALSVLSTLKKRRNHIQIG